MLIFKDKDLNLSNVRLGDEKINNVSIYKNTVYYNNNIILLQTPRCKIRNQNIHVRYFNRKFIKIYLIFEENNAFINLVTNIEDKLKDLYQKKFNKTHNWKSCLTCENNRYFMKVNIPIDESGNYLVNIFDLNKTRKSIEYIVYDSESLNIITPYEIWRSNSNYGINWNLLQSKIFLPIFCSQECLIIDEFEDDPKKHYHNIVSKKQNNTSLSDYNKYYKMYQMGIPLGAINIEIKKNKDLCYEKFKNLFNIKEDGKFKIKYIPLVKKKSTTKVENNKLRSNFKPPTENDLKKILNNLKKII